MSKLAPEVGDVFNIIFPEYTVLAVVIEDTEREIRILRKYKYDFEKRYTYDVASVNKKTEPDYYNAIFHKRATYLGKSKASIEQLFEVKDEKWINVKELGKEGEDYDLIPSNEFLQCVESEGFIDEDGIGVEAIEINGTIFYCDEKPIYPSEVYEKKKLDCDYVVWWNR